MTEAQGEIIIDALTAIFALQLGALCVHLIRYGDHLWSLFTGSKRRAEWMNYQARDRDA